VLGPRGGRGEIQRSDAVADVEHRWEVSERERQGKFEELISQELGLRGVPCQCRPPQVRNHLLEGMQLAALRHSKIAEELAMLQAVGSSLMESVLRCSPDDNF
jgi:hypothetical protein